jgi:hypothetical protein
VSGSERFLFLYFKYLYFRSLKHFWDCDFNFVNVLELHIKAWRNDQWYNKSFDLAFHFSFNQNKLWTSWRPNRALSYNKLSILYRTVGPVKTNVWLRNLKMKIESYLKIIMRSEILFANKCCFPVYLKIEIN